MTPAVDYDAIAARLRGGALAIFPTETLVGIGCDPRHAGALARLGALKGRPESQPYPLLVPDLAHARRLAVVPAAAERLADGFWPGMITLVLPAREEVPAAWTAADRTLALRVTGHPVAGPLVAALAGPLVATSANPSGAPPPARLADVDPALRRAVEIVLPEHGPPSAGAGSTIVRVTVDDAIAVLRDGAVDRAAIDACLAAGSRP